MEPDDRIRADAEAIIGGDRPSHATPEQAPPNPVSGFVGLLIYPYRKWVIGFGLPVCVGLVVFGIVTRSSTDKLDKASRLCVHAVLQVRGPAASMGVEATTAGELRADFRDEYGHDNQLLASVPAGTAVAVCRVHAPNDPAAAAIGGTAKIAVFPDGSTTWLVPQGP